MGSALLIVLLFVASLAVSAAVLSVTGRIHADRAPEHRYGDRPWWGNPLVWVGVSAVALVLGLVVAPRLLGGIILFLPLIWVRGLGRRGQGGRPRREEPPP
ncbi:MAG: hypothetical protein ACE14W_08190 [Candidatus Velamenicoccus archaeovorus]